MIELLVWIAHLFRDGDYFDHRLPDRGEIGGSAFGGDPMCIGLKVERIEHA